MSGEIGSIALVQLLSHQRTITTTILTRIHTPMEVVEEVAAAAFSAILASHKAAAMDKARKPSEQQIHCDRSLLSKSMKQTSLIQMQTLRLMENQLDMCHLLVLFEI